MVDIQAIQADQKTPRGDKSVGQVLRLSGRRQNDLEIGRRNVKESRLSLFTSLRRSHSGSIHWRGLRISISTSRCRGLEL